MTFRFDKGMTGFLEHTNSSFDHFDAPHFSPLLVLPVKRYPVFPGFMVHHMIQDEKTIDAILTNSEKFVGLFLRKDADASPKDVIESTDDIYNVGTIGVIQQIGKKNCLKTIY